MKALIVVVDELPSECGVCKYCDFERDIDGEAYGLYCTLADKSLDNEDDYEYNCDIPRWCPLPQGWISVEDRLPIKHISVILWVEAGSWCKGWLDHEGRWRSFDTSVSHETYVPMVTHWMPLREPPKEDE